MCNAETIVGPLKSLSLAQFKKFRTKSVNMLERCKAVNNEKDMHDLWNDVLTEYSWQKVHDTASIGHLIPDFVRCNKESNFAVANPLSTVAAAHLMIGYGLDNAHRGECIYHVRLLM